MVSIYRVLFNYIQNYLWWIIITDLKFEKGNGYSDLVDYENSLPWIIPDCCHEPGFCLLWNKVRWLGGMIKEPIYLDIFNWYGFIHFNSLITVHNYEGKVVILKWKGALFQPHRIWKLESVCCETNQDLCIVRGLDTNGSIGLSGTVGFQPNASVPVPHKAARLGSIYQYIVQILICIFVIPSTLLTMQLLAQTLKLLPHIEVCAVDF